MAFHAIFNILSIISLLPVHLSILSKSSYKCSTQYSFQATGCFPIIAVVKRINRDGRGVNPVAMTESSQRMFAKPGIEPATCCSVPYYLSFAILEPREHVLVLTEKSSSDMWKIIHSKPR